MEVHGRQPGDLHSARDRFEKNQERLEQSTRERIQRARAHLEGLSSSRGEALREARQAAQAEVVRETSDRRADAASSRPQHDVLELSSDRRERTAHEAARREHVEELRLASENGTLNSPERIERAATNLLSE